MVREGLRFQFAVEDGALEVFGDRRHSHKLWACGFAQAATFGFGLLQDGRGNFILLGEGSFGELHSQVTLVLVFRYQIHTHDSHRNVRAGQVVGFFNPGLDLCLDLLAEGACQSKPYMWGY